MPKLNNGGWYSSNTYFGFLRAANCTTSDVDGVTTVVLQYLIGRLDGGVVDFLGDDYQNMVNEAMLPPMGFDVGNWEGTSFTKPSSFARLREIEFESLKTGECIATCRFTGLYSISPSSFVTQNPYTHLPVNVELSTQLRAMKVWRRTWATNPPTGSDQTGDIAGFAAANGRDGMIIEVPQTKFRMRFVQDATSATMMSQATTLSNYINKINSATFYNFPAGSVICEGVSLVKVSNEYYEVIFDFLYDSFNHHEQVPDYDPLGQVDINSSGNAKTVKWTRTSRSSTDFNNIYGGDATLQAIAEKGWW